MSAADPTLILLHFCTTLCCKFERTNMMNSHVVICYRMCILGQQTRTYWRTACSLCSLLFLTSLFVGPHNFNIVRVRLNINGSKKDKMRVWQQSVRFCMCGRVKEYVVWMSNDTYDIDFNHICLCDFISLHSHWTSPSSWNRPQPGLPKIITCLLLFT